MGKKERILQDETQYHQNIFGFDCAGATKTVRLKVVMRRLQQSGAENGEKY